MIVEFRVFNYRSIKSEQELSFRPTKSQKNLENFTYEIEPGIRLLKLASLYGPNAGGKSNILKALVFLLRKMRYTQEKGVSTGFVPFKFSQATVDKPGNFYLEFYAGKDEPTKYTYQLKIDEKKIIHEELNYFPKSRSALVYSRELKDDSTYEWKFGSTVSLDKVERKTIKLNTLQNMTVISAFKKVEIKFEELENVFNWAGRNFAYNLGGNLIDIKFENEKYYKEMGTFSTAIFVKQVPEKELILKLLKKAEMGIKDISVKKKKMKINKNNETKTVDFPDLATLFFHRNIDGKQTKLKLTEESSGTQKFFSFIGYLILILGGGGNLIVDELEASLHPDLFNYIINYFLVNTKSAQLIFTTHNLQQLNDSENVRKDVVWFVEKNKEYETELYSLADFSDDRSKNYAKSYLAGKYGAIPKLGSIFKE